MHKGMHVHLQGMLYSIWEYKPLGCMFLLQMHCIIPSSFISLILRQKHALHSDISLTGSFNSLSLDQWQTFPLLNSVTDLTALDTPLEWCVCV